MSSTNCKDTGTGREILWAARAMQLKVQTWMSTFLGSSKASKLISFYLLPLAKLLFEATLGMFIWKVPKGPHYGYWISPEYFWKSYKFVSYPFPWWKTSQSRPLCLSRRHDLVNTTFFRLFRVNLRNPVCRGASVDQRLVFAEGIMQVSNLLSYLVLGCLGDQ